jgi:hypothetical protein
VGSPMDDPHQWRRQSQAGLVSLGRAVAFLLVLAVALWLPGLTDETRFKILIPAGGLALLAVPVFTVHGLTLVLAAAVRHGRWGWAAVTAVGALLAVTGFAAAAWVVWAWGVWILTALWLAFGGFLALYGLLLYKQQVKNPIED